jgi:hypothetical protein
MDSFALKPVMLKTSNNLEKVSKFYEERLQSIKAFKKTE